MAAIFISHSSRDGDAADQLKRWLAEQGYENVFLDFDKHTGLKAGEHWERQLYEEIARSHAVILILSPHWLASKWCFVEFTQARALGKVIFPIVVSPLGDTAIAPEIQGIDLRDWNADGKEMLRQRIQEISQEAARGFKWDPARPPYPGIHSFDSDDAAIFFGRDPEVREVIERLEARRVQGGSRLLLMLGASGSGKSSLLKAGVLPRLKRQKAQWIVAAPFRPEREPFTQVAKCLAETIGQADAWRSLRDRLRGEAARACLKTIADDLRVGPARGASLLLPIDQFEESFTIAETSERTAFLDLLRLIAHPDQGLPYLVIGTIRSDVLGELVRIEELTAPFESYALRPLPGDRLTRVIEGPAGVAAVALEKGLPQQIADDVDAQDALPLMAFALRELYERFGHDRRLTIADYQRLGDPQAGLSPIENAVRRKADDVIGALRPGPDGLVLLKQAFVPHLVRLRDDGTFVRQAVRLADLPDGVQRWLDAFVEARLLSRRVDAASGEAVLEVAHEALFKAWPLLAGWLDEERDFLLGKARLDHALADWQKAAPAQKSNALLHGLQLARARRWLVTHPHGLTADETAFIRASRRRARQRRLIAGGLAAAALLVLGVSGARALYGEYIRRTALACDLLAAETDNNVFVAGVEFDRIDTAAAIPACEKALQVDAVSPRLMHNLGRALDAAGRFTDAAYWYRRAADLNWAWSQNNLGVLYLYGRGVPLDIGKGVALLRSAAEQNNAAAKTNYAGTDFSVLFESSPARAGIVEKALIKKGLLAPGAAGAAGGTWSLPLRQALAIFKKAEGLDEAGVTLRVLDRLGVVDELSASAARSHP